jgi:ABC-type amino acid transport substrate-binding protein
MELAARLSMGVRRQGVLVLLGLMVGAANAAVEPVGIAYFKGSARSKVGALIMVEVYKRAGISTYPLPLPGARNALASESSEVVGESVRVMSYTEAHPKLTRVDPPVTYWTTAAFYKTGSAVNLGEANDLKNYSVGYVLGTQAPADVIKDLGVNRVTTTASPDQLFKMLESDRFDIAIDGGTNGDFWIRQMGYRNISEFEINRIPLFHFLSPKYRDLAPTLSTIIKKMIASGELDKITRKAEQEVLEGGLDP